MRRDVLNIFFLCAATCPSISSDSEIVGTLFFCPPCHALLVCISHGSIIPFSPALRRAPRSGCPPTRRVFASVTHPSSSIEKHYVLSPTLYSPFYLPGTLSLSLSSNVPCTFIAVVVLLIHVCSLPILYPAPPRQQGMPPILLQVVWRHPSVG